MARKHLRGGVYVVLFSVLLLVCLSTAASPVGAQSGDRTAVAISNVTANPEGPTAGEPFSLRVTISNFEGSQGTATINDLVVEIDGERRYVSEHLGQLTPGSQMTVTVPVKIDESGQHTIALELYGSASGLGVINTRAPFVVDVRKIQRPSLGLTILDTDSGSESDLFVPDMVAGETREINVTIANGNTESLQNVRLRLRGTGRAEITNARRVGASLTTGEELTHSFRVTFPKAGSHSLNATLRYDTSSGRTRTVHQRERIDIEQAISDVTLDVSNRLDNDSSVIRAELHQFGNVELRDVVLRVDHDGRTVARVPVENVPSDGSRNVTVDDTDIPAGDVTITAAYTAGAGRETTSEGLGYSEYAPAPTSSITLTDLNLVREGDTLRIDGDAANVGTTQVSSVVVSVVETANVSPAEPNREYFIEDIDATEFATFQAAAQVPMDVGHLPIRIEYTINGQRVSTIESIDVTDVTAQSDDSRGNGPPVLLIGVLVLLVVAFAFVRYRRRNR